MAYECAIPKLRNTEQGLRALVVIHNIIAMPYSTIPDQAPRRIACAIVLSVVAALCACSAGSGGLAILDPAMAVLLQDSVQLYRKTAGELLVLPTEDPSAALYAELDKRDPAWIILSPLLAQELSSIRKAKPDIPIAICTQEPVDPAYKTCSSVFTREEAAKLAAVSIAQHTAQGGLTLALFSGPGSDEAAKAFNQAWIDAQAPGEPVLRIVSGGFSVEIATELRNLDVSAAYIDVPPAQSALWATRAFDESTFVALALPFGLKPGYGGSDALIVWDIQSALSRLKTRIISGNQEPEAFSSENAAWKVLFSR